MCEVVDRADQGREQVLDFFADQGDQVLAGGQVAALGGCGDGKEGVSEHCERDPAVPGGSAAHLVLVQSDQALAGLERLLDRPASSGHPYQFRQCNRPG